MVGLFVGRAIGVTRIRPLSPEIVKIAYLRNVFERRQMAALGCISRVVALVLFPMATFGMTLSRGLQRTPLSERTYIGLALMRPFVICKVREVSLSSY